MTNQATGGTAKPQPPAEDWHTMSDAEVMARLLRRGVEPVFAKGLVRDREREAAAEEIDDTLTRVYLDDQEQPIKFEHPLDRRVRR